MNAIALDEKPSKRPYRKRRLVGDEAIMRGMTRCSRVFRNMSKNERAALLVNLLMVWGGLKPSEIFPGLMEILTEPGGLGGSRLAPPSAEGMTKPARPNFNKHSL